MKVSENLTQIKTVWNLTNLLSNMTNHIDGNQY